MLVLLLEDKRIKGGILLSFFAVFLFTIIDKIKNERKDKKVILKRTITLVERVAFKSSKDSLRWGFYETPIPEKLKNRTKHNS